MADANDEREMGRRLIAAAVYAAWRDGQVYVHVREQDAPTISIRVDFHGMPLYAERHLPLDYLRPIFEHPDEWTRDWPPGTYLYDPHWDPQSRDVWTLVPPPEGRGPPRSPFSDLDFMKELEDQQ
jgi:hypothetical protein